MSGAKKIPPYIARELKRHVKSKQQAGPAGSGGNSAGKKDNSRLYTFLGCTAFIGVTASFPFMGMAWIGRLSDRDEVCSFIVETTNCPSSSSSKIILFSRFLYF